MTIIVVFVTVCGVIAVSGIIVLRYREQQTQQEAKRIGCPLATAGLPKSRSKVSVNESIDAAHEYQRGYIIQKSLASRSSSRESRPDTANIVNEAYRGRNNESPYCGSYDGDSQNEKQSALIDDWKEFEAGIRRDRSRSLRRHPSSTKVLTHPPLVRRDSAKLRTNSRALSMTEEEKTHEDGREFANDENMTNSDDKEGNDTENVGTRCREKNGKIYDCRDGKHREMMERRKSTMSKTMVRKRKMIILRRQRRRSQSA